MKKGEDTISSFVTGKFRDSCTIRMRVRMESEENNIRNTIAEINRLPTVTSYTAAQKEDKIEAYKKSLRRLEDRKAFYYKRIKSLENIKPNDFETLLKKNPKYDGFSIDDKGRLSLYTTMLKDGVKSIGRFRLIIWPDQSSSLTFRAVNLDYHRGELNHWAVNSFTCCLGEWQMDFEGTLWMGDIPKFFELFTHYIELSPQDNTYTTKEDWYENREKRSSAESKSLKEDSFERFRDNCADEDEEQEEDEDYR